MSCSCFRAAPDSPQSFYTAGGASFVSAQTFVSAHTAFASPQASLPDRSPPPPRARSLAAALEEAAGADVVVGRPFPASGVSSEGRRLHPRGAADLPPAALGVAVSHQVGEAGGFRTRLKTWTWRPARRRAASSRSGLCWVRLATRCGRCLGAGRSRRPRPRQVSRRRLWWGACVRARSATLCLGRRRERCGGREREREFHPFTILQEKIRVWKHLPTLSHAKAGSRAAAAAAVAAASPHPNHANAASTAASAARVPASRVVQ